MSTRLNCGIAPIFSVGCASTLILARGGLSVPPQGRLSDQSRPRAEGKKTAPDPGTAEQVRARAKDPFEVRRPQNSRARARNLLLHKPAGRRPRPSERTRRGRKKPVRRTSFRKRSRTLRAGRPPLPNRRHEPGGYLLDERTGGPQLTLAPPAPTASEKTLHPPRSTAPPKQAGRARASKLVARPSKTAAPLPPPRRSSSSRPRHRRA